MQAISPQPKPKTKTPKKRSSKLSSSGISNTSKGSRKSTDEAKNNSNTSVLSQLNSSFGSLDDQEHALSFFSDAKKPTTSKNIPPPPPESPLLMPQENNNAKFTRFVSKYTDIFYIPNWNYFEYIRKNSLCLNFETIWSENCEKLHSKGESEINPERAKIIETDKKIDEELRDQRERDLPEVQSETSKLEPVVEKSTMSSSDSESDSSFEDSKSPKWLLASVKKWTYLSIKNSAYFKSSRNRDT